MTTMSLIHDPQARLDYEWDWSNWLADGETILNHLVTVTPPDEMLIDTDTATSETVTAWVHGGVLGRSYQLTCHIVTTDGREDDRKFVLSVKNR